MSKEYVTIGIWAELKNGLELMAAQETERVGYPVKPGALLSKLLSDGKIVRALSEKELEEGLTKLRKKQEAAASR